jgi:ABC-type dipeptide/oligopeptide/nickel transport system permease subunit
MDSAAFVTLRRIARSAGTILAICYLLLLVTTAVFAPMIAPMSPIVQNPANTLAPPSDLNLLGTDDLGRDVYSSMIYGVRSTLAAGLVAIAVASVPRRLCCFCSPLRNRPRRLRTCRHGA